MTSEDKPNVPPFTQPRLPLVLALFALVPAGLLLLAVSVPGGDIRMLLLAAVLWLLDGLLWARGIARSRAVWTDARRWGAWIIAPAILAVSCAVAFTGLPLSARFEMSRPAFERLATQPPGPDDLESVGLYRVCCFATTDFGYQFGVNDGVLITWASPTAPTAHRPDQTSTSDRGRTCVSKNRLIAISLVFGTSGSSDTAEGGKRHS